MKTKQRCLWSDKEKQNIMKEIKTNCWTGAYDVFLLLFVFDLSVCSSAVKCA